MLLALFLIAAPVQDAECAQVFACNDTVYELVYQGHPIVTPDMDEAECEALRSQIQEQTQALFSSLVCRARYVEREKS